MSLLRQQTSEGRRRCRWRFLFRGDCYLGIARITLNITPWELAEMALRTPWFTIRLVPDGVFRWCSPVAKAPRGRSSRITLFFRVQGPRVTLCDGDITVFEHFFS